MENASRNGFLTSGWASIRACSSKWSMPTPSPRTTATIFFRKSSRRCGTRSRDFAANRRSPPGFTESRSTARSPGHAKSASTATKPSRSRRTSPSSRKRRGRRIAGSAGSTSKLRGLDHVDRSLTLLLLDGFSYREMAETLGISESYVGVKSIGLKPTSRT